MVLACNKWQATPHGDWWEFLVADAKLSRHATWQLASRQWTQCTTLGRVGWVVYPYLGGLGGPLTINTLGGFGGHIHYDNILKVLEGWAKPPVRYANEGFSMLQEAGHNTW